MFVSDSDRRAPSRLWFIQTSRRLRNRHDFIPTRQTRIPILSLLPSSNCCVRPPGSRALSGTVDAAAHQAPTGRVQLITSIMVERVQSPVCRNNTLYDSDQALSRTILVRLGSAGGIPFSRQRRWSDEDRWSSLLPITSPLRPKRKSGADCRLLKPDTLRACAFGSRG